MNAINKMNSTELATAIDARIADGKKPTQAMLKRLKALNEQPFEIEPLPAEDALEPEKVEPYRWDDATGIVLVEAYMDSLAKDVANDAKGAYTELRDLAIQLLEADSEIEDADKHWKATWKAWTKLLNTFEDALRVDLNGMASKVGADRAASWSEESPKYILSDTWRKAKQCTNDAFKFQLDFHEATEGLNGKIPKAIRQLQREARQARADSKPAKKVVDTTEDSAGNTSGGVADPLAGVCKRLESISAQVLREMNAILENSETTIEEAGEQLKALANALDSALGNEIVESDMSKAMTSITEKMAATG